MTAEMADDLSLGRGVGKPSSAADTQFYRFMPAERVNSANLQPFLFRKAPNTTGGIQRPRSSGRDTERYETEFLWYRLQ